MIVNRCKFDTRDKVTGDFACVNMHSAKFSELKTYVCSNATVGCKLWEPYNPISVLLFDDDLPFYPVKLLARII